MQSVLSKQTAINNSLNFFKNQKSFTYKIIITEGNNYNYNLSLFNDENIYDYVKLSSNIKSILRKIKIYYIHVNNSYQYNSYQYSKEFDLIFNILPNEIKQEILSYLDTRLNYLTLIIELTKLHKLAYENYQKNCYSDMVFFSNTNWIQYNRAKNTYYKSFIQYKKEFDLIQLDHENKYMMSHVI